MKTPPDLPEGHENDTSVLGLIRQLAHEVPALINKEIALAKAEIRESVQTSRQALMSIGAGAVMILGGFIVLLQAVVYVLTHFMASWLAALIVAVVVMMVGYLMIKGGNRKLEPSNLAPERTASTLQKDKDAIQRKVS
ncbi:phage holin family protein [Pseudomonas capsici]|uniref:Phage holin family protein n=1 Tax=Pseudomonas capsici TaxID=2810614 RepID=A0ABT3BSC3_9PSED|nr:MULTISPECIES: phage holin family protein [Pseudomonas]MBN6715304.1 phage holin family protein [Pseudomonas capsici]MBN6720299.1 phage holin family protein [Pseudomonas capsici]MBN6725205.1 phage holin family protein [Pseudomonas capsici]MBX8475289.1 phage holin family protein [Pseudomonas cichorii]MCV4268024.1 phage holin family protein [Pseudomonas capsici]